MKVLDISATVDSLIKHRSAVNRYASFDYCYSNFHPSNRHLRSIDLDRDALELGFYLASWGMLRGSSFLLTKSYKHLVPLVEHIRSCPESLWKIDCNRYSDDNIEALIDCYHRIKDLLIHDNNSHLTLVTKVMLGVFANTPAYDRFFKESFRQMYKGACSFNSFNKASLQCVSTFYLSNSEDVNRLRQRISVLRPKPSFKALRYTRARIVDMYGVAKGIQGGT